MGIVRKGVAYYLEVRGKAHREINKNKKALKGLRTEAKAAAKGVGVVTAGFAAAGAAAVAYANDITNAIDQLTTLASSTGLALETVAGIELAAKASGKELKDLVPNDLAKRVREAQLGTGEALKGFEALGMTLDGKLSPAFKTSDGVMRGAIDRIMAIEDPTKRSALAIQALGENGAQLISAFGDSGDLDAFVAMAGKYGTDVGPEARRITAEWQQSTTLMSMALQKLKSDMLPIVDLMADTVRGFAAMAIGAKAFVTEGGLLFHNWPSAFGAARDEVMEFAKDLKGMNDELARTSEEAEKAAAHAKNFTPPDVMQGLAASNAKAAKEALAKAKKEAEERAKAAAKAGAAARKAAEEAEARGLRLGLDTYDVGGKKVHKEKLFSDLDTSLSQAVAELAEVMEGIVGALDEADKKKKAESDAEKAQRMSHASSQEQRKRDPLGTAVGEFKEAINGSPIGMAVTALSALPSTLSSLQQTIETLPELLVDVPNLLVSTLTSLTDLPTALAQAAPEIALALADAVFSSFIVGGEIVATTLSLVFEQLPGDIAQAIAEVLKSLGGELNPFDGDGRFLGGLGAKVGESDFLGMDIPFLDKGGGIQETGLAMVHTGERVQTSKEVRNGGARGGPVFNIGSVGTNDPRAFLQQLQHMLGPYGGGMGLVGAAGGLGG